MSAHTWAILTGEYPPKPGGVSDYTRQVARALAERGEVVHVFAPPTESAPPLDGGISFRALPDHFGLQSIHSLSAEMDRLRDESYRAGRGRVRLLVQYVPHAFAMRAMNVPFCLWIATRRRREDVAVMFHEVMYPSRHGQSVRHELLAQTHRLMARLLVRACRRTFVSIPAW